MISTGPSLRAFLRFLTERRTLLISAPFSRGVMSVFSTSSHHRVWEPFQFPTKFRSPSRVGPWTESYLRRSLESSMHHLGRRQANTDYLFGVLSR